MSSACGFLSTGLRLYKNASGNNTSISGLKNEIHEHSIWYLISHLTQNNLHYKEKPFNTLPLLRIMLHREPNVLPIIEKRQTNLMSLAILFHHLLLNMFPMLVHPIFRSLRLTVDLFHVLYFSGSMCVGVTVWFGWGGVVSLCRLKH